MSRASEAALVFTLRVLTHAELAERFQVEAGLFL